MNLSDLTNKITNAGQKESANSLQVAVPEFYSNSILINISPFELEIQNLLVDSQQNLKGAINIRMSPQTAWTLAKGLTKQLAMYEQKFGQISLPDEVRRAME